MKIILFMIVITGLTVSCQPQKDDPGHGGYRQKQEEASRPTDYTEGSDTHTKARRHAPKND